MTRTGGLSVAIFAGAAAAGCSLVTDLGDQGYTLATPDGSIGDSGVRPGDASSEVGDSGVDAIACVTTPDGWSPVALTSGACPSGFGNSQSFVSGVTAGPYECDCDCGGPQGCTGTAVLNQYSDGGCTGTVTASYPITLSTSCGQGGLPSVVMGDGYALSNVAFGAGPACTATPHATSMPQPTTQNVTVCVPNATCAGGARLGSAQLGAMCISHPGTVGCPNDFPTMTTIASQVTDTRGCGSCSCASTLACTFTDVLFDSETACATDLPYNFTASSACVPAPGTFAINSGQTHATQAGSGTCTQTSPSSAVGAVELNPSDVTTVCCPLCNLPNLGTATSQACSSCITTKYPLAACECANDPNTVQLEGQTVTACEAYLACVYLAEVDGGVLAAQKALQSCAQDGGIPSSSSTLGGSIALDTVQGCPVCTP